jgi:hypothetical protein
MPVRAGVLAKELRQMQTRKGMASEPRKALAKVLVKVRAKAIAKVKVKATNILARVQEVTSSSAKFLLALRKTRNFVWCDV